MKNKIKEEEKRRGKKTTLYREQKWVRPFANNLGLRLKSTEQSLRKQVSGRKELAKEPRRKWQTLHFHRK